jgi:hypothetical protein
MSARGEVAFRLSPRRRAASVLSILWLALTQRALAQGSEDRRPVTASEIALLLTALRDEIYARGDAPRYLDMPADSIPVYVNPQLEHGYIWVIYKRLPFGELHRAAWLSSDRRFALLAGDPDDGFPPTRETAMPTIYMNDDDVMKMKAMWKHAWIQVAFRPIKSELEAAKRRQAVRDSIRGLGR